MRLFEFSQSTLLEAIGKENPGYNPSELLRVVEAHRLNEWKELIFENDGKAVKKEVQILVCPLFKETSEVKLRNSSLKNKFESFLQTKKANPMQPFGSSDKPYISGAFYSKEVPGIRHAHLTFDISVAYTISGSNPTVIKLYAMLTHDEGGTGQPPNIRKQKAMAKQLGNQNKFTSV